MITDYIILHKTNSQILADDVREKLRLGYVLSGNLVVTAVMDDYCTPTDNFYQAMIKNQEK